ncbi:hypothetical protein KTO58_14715 [Chitinophaga pendula]|uniref:hypothetical protein n=1 Tax=Chitinophaga TaxID=79328 RepID=UPI0012FD843D|nr:MULTISPECIES: hypothetical protein [Chitinophaga]UCJ04953.1 hypothetical protein KTO58_14715 [Chitinophaga pendula]
MKKKIAIKSFDVMARTQLKKVNGGGRSTARPFCEAISCNNQDEKCPTRFCVCGGDTCFG